MWSFHGSICLRSSDWADRCVYQCRVCLPPAVFDTHSKMSYHVKKRHKMAMKGTRTIFFWIGSQKLIY